MKSIYLIISKCCIAIVAIIIASLLLETSLRLSGYQLAKTPFSWLSNTGLFKIDNKVIYRTQPNYINTFSKEYTNTLGMKIYDPTDQLLSESKYTIVVLGDSFVWGNTIYNDTYPQQLQDILNIKSTKIKVYNAGISGYGTDQEYMYFIQYVLPKIHPDIVVWNINTNDVSDNVNIPLFDIRDGELVQISPWRNGVYITARFSEMLPDSLKRESRLLNVVLRGLERLQLYRIARKDNLQWALDKIDLEIHQMQALAKKNNFILYIAVDPTQCVIENLDCGLTQAEETIAIGNLVENKNNLIDQTNYIMSATSSGEFFLDEPNTFPKGWWHPNAQGNFLMAMSVMEKFQQDQSWIFNQPE